VRHLSVYTPSDASIDDKSALLGPRISLQDYAVAFLVVDSLILVGLGVAVSYFFGLNDPRTHSLPQWETPALLIAGLLYILTTGNLRTYSTRTILDRSGTVLRVTWALGVTFTLFLVVAAATKTTQDYSRLWFFSWALSSWLTLILVRLAALKYVDSRLQNGAAVDTSLSVGMFCDPLSLDAVARMTRGMTRVARAVRLDDLEQLTDLCDVIVRDQIDQVHISTPWQHVPQVLRTLSGLSHLSAEVVVLPHCRDFPLNGMRVSGGDKPLSLYAVERPIRGWDLWLKRKEDLAIAIAALTAFAPLMLVIAILIKIESPGPVFFRQKRAGFNGSVFEVLKFRSMFHHFADPGAERQTGKNDSRVTRVGRFIRRTSLDELPQLFNVLQGTMSIVGPRPHALQTQTEGQDLDKLVDYYASRHRVKPGITGLAQVNGLRGELDRIHKLQRRVDCDIYYIDNWSLWLDLKILLKTILLVFYDEHAY
jgi:Undecaprenyl-phosphate glucose phosphotransferase